MVKYILFIFAVMSLVGCAHAPKRDLASNCQIPTSNYYDVFQQYERCQNF